MMILSVILVVSVLATAFYLLDGQAIRRQRP